MAHASLAPVSVLYLGTDEATAERIAAKIERAHDAIEATTVTSPAAALAFIEANHVDCLVSADVDRYRPNPAGERGEGTCEELAADIFDVLGDRTRRVDMLDRMTDGFMALDDDLGWITGDEGRLQQLFENLFRNAVEHGSTSPPSSSTREDAVEHAVDADRVTVRVGRLTDGAGFYVEDDGPGVPAAGREEIFEWGYTTRDGGTGFGLATVEQIVDAHGATITVTDAASGGARFEIRGIPTR